jgi:predicted nucleic acid-binding protein
VHRASEEHRGAREAFVEATLEAFVALSFDLLVARIHARLWATLASSGVDVGAHDRIVAATAISMGWRVGSANTRHFSRIPGLNVTPISLA